MSSVRVEHPFRIDDTLPWNDNFSNDFIKMMNWTELKENWTLRHSILYKGPRANLSFPQLFSDLPIQAEVETIVTVCLKLQALQAVQNDILIISIKKGWKISAAI